MLVNADIQLKRKSFQTGFTLIELVITLAIVALLISLAAPAFSDFIRQTRLINATRALHDAMNLARMESIKRNGQVDLIAHEDNWKNGWVMKADNQIIFNHDALYKDIAIVSTFREKKAAIAYNGTGHTRTESSTTGTTSGTLRLSLGKHSRLIVVNFLGRVRVCNPAHTPRTCVISAPEQTE